MDRIKLPMTVVLVAVFVAGMAVPAAAAVGPTANDRSDSTAVGLAAADETNGSSVNVTVGQQLSTVVAATGDEVQTDFEDAAFEVTYESANESDRAEVVAERAEALRERAARVNEDYEEVTAAYRAGELDESAYAQRVAVLNARAKNILRSYERLNDRAENVSALDLRAVGLNRTGLNRAAETLDAVTGGGPSAILERYTGRTDGELEIEVDDGLAVEVESEDGDRSLEVERPRDGDDSMTVSQSLALATAREAIPPAPDNGTWTLTRSSVHSDSGYYRFEFALRAANETGETEVRVDGSSGSVFRLEQEVESADERGDAERESDDAETEDDRELALVVADGTPAPNATITVKALSGGEPAANATVYVDDRAVGTTGNAGTVTLTLPQEGVTVEAVRDDREAELEFEFEDREDDVFRRLNVSGSVDDGDVTVSIQYEGAPVSGATVYADGDRVGTTGADGAVTFATTASEELEVEVVKGEFEAELTFAVSGDALSLAEEPHEGDGDRTDDEDERESDAEDDEDEREDDETTEEDEDDEREDDEEDDTTTEEEDDEDEETTEEDEDDDEDDETTTEDE